MIDGRTQRLMERFSIQRPPDEAALAALEAEWAALSERARRAADERISPEQLASQLEVIERRLDGQPARVLQFPLRRGSLQGPRPLRRWVAMAAACGLVFGLAAGRMIGPGWAPDPARGAWSAPTARPYQAVAHALEPAVADERLLGEVDAAIARTLHADFRALDELTPAVATVRGRP